MGKIQRGELVSQTRRRIIKRGVGKLVILSYELELSGQGSAES
jgi:hypothetical protein